MKSFFKKIIAVVAVIAVGYGGYYMYNNDHVYVAGANPSSLTATVVHAQDAGLVDSGNPSQDFLALLLGVQSIKLDDSLFTNKAFTVLQDFNRPIPADTNPGRANPFAPIGQDGVIIDTQISTSNPSAISSTSVTLNGTLTLSDPSVTRWFEYGTTPSLGTMTGPHQQPTAGAFAESINGLTPDTTYYFEASASVNGSTVSGKVLSFKTTSKTSH